jgi:hypothetical protein
MTEIKLAQKLAKTAKEVQDASTGIHDLVTIMYTHIKDVAEAAAACGKMGVRMNLFFPEVIKTPKAISTANKKIISLLEADGFSYPTIFNSKGSYELKFQFED